LQLPSASFRIKSTLTISPHDQGTVWSGLALKPNQPLARPNPDPTPNSADAAEDEVNRTQYTELAPWIAIIVLYLVTLPILWAYALDTAIRDQLVYAGQTLPIETSIPKSEASHADPYREREVMAQITAANAAYGSMVISKWALFASVVGGLVAAAGAYYVKRTFDQTNRALQHAEKSASAAWEAVEQTRKTNQIAERAMLLDQRPWITIQLESVTIRNVSKATTVIDIAATVENIGRSPALERQSVSLATRLPIWPPERDKYWREWGGVDYQSIIPHGAGGKFRYTSSFTLQAHHQDPEPSRFVLLRIGVLYAMNGSAELFETLVAFDLILTDDRLAQGVPGAYSEGFEIKHKPGQGWMT